MPKRKREQTKTKNGRPPPPPPPPRSLVRLLQSNKNVLEYFTLLQDNLEADKEKWKIRASDFEKECILLEEKVEKQKFIIARLEANQNVNTMPPCQDNSSIPSRVDTVEAKKTSHERNLNDEIIKSKKSLDFPQQSSNTSNSTVEDCEGGKFTLKSIDNAVMESWWNDLSSDESSLAVKENRSLSVRASSFPENLSTSIRTLREQKSQSNESMKTFFSKKLKEAHENLECLGVALVEDGKRRCDADVVADLLQALRTVTRVQLLKGRKNSTEISPFINMEPGCNCKEHPVYQAKQCLLTALRIMDKYCIKMEIEEWDKITRSSLGEGECQSSIISIGMFKRQSLARRFIQSLKSEISTCWPILDRASRINSSTLHYDHKREEREYKYPDENDFGVKSQVRLSNILERITLVQLLTSFFDDQNNLHGRIILFFQYVITSAPSLIVEQYPKYPPVLSICIAEALLTKDGEAKDSFSAEFAKYNDFLQSAFTAVHIVAIIWRQRLKSIDDRITDIARVELSSYERLLNLNLNWIGKPFPSIEEIETKCTSKDVEHSLFASTVSAIVFSDDTFLADLETSDKESTWKFLERAFVFSVVKQQLEIRQLPHYRESIGFAECKDSFLRQTTFLNKFMVKLECIDSKEELYLKYSASLLRCCLFLSNGSSAANVAESMIKINSRNTTNKLSSLIFQPIMEAALTPLIRVINLKRRTDRRNAFQSQAKIEKLLIVYAVASFDAKHNEDSYYWGNFAFDGNSNYVESLDTARVGRHWRPSDLKAFDKDAWDNGSPVKMSRSERACAFSHVASWEGVRRSLEFPHVEMTHPFPHSHNMQRLFKISGFARGKALHKINFDIPPTPLCIIMEDDAILVDRFSERLEELLEELPRDFHFCSIGYSRPRHAPIVAWSSQVGIPSCIWYLTGYLLSLEGAKYLLGKLPVQGPIDSWVGLKMCANWENKYGQLIGVGMQTKQAEVSPSREELELILKFRAFCALTPLCSQRIGMDLAMTGRSWRQRDTDIEYSGSH